MQMKNEQVTMQISKEQVAMSKVKKLRSPLPPAHC
jgi:hypothetical protein